MLKFGQFVTKHKKIILIIAIILLIPSILGMKATRTNYNILAYLPSDLETVQGQDVLADDFHRGAYAILVVDNMPSKDILKLEDKIKKVSTVKDVASVADATGTSIPKEALPDEIKNKIYSGDETIIFVTFENAISDDQTMDAVSEIKKIAGTQCKVSGMTATLLDTKDLSDREVSIYVLIAVALCLLILQLALDSYFAPFLILINIGIAILYNMGTNIMFGEISYITKAISAVLQLGVTMDFAIFLYHSY
jgi:predicted RND superfamily exporter protein